MSIAAAFLAMMLWSGAASAHGPVLVTPDALHLAWNFDPLVLAPLILTHWLYGRGISRVWARAGRGHGVSIANVTAFTVGEAVLVLALVSPLDQLGGTLLSAHMVQHALLIAVAPPLLLLGQPGAALAWALPVGRRRSLLASRIWRALIRLCGALSRPLPAAVLSGAVLWLWHAPGLFDAALERSWLHAVEHATFFATALLFWCAIIGARAGRRIGPALGATLATLIHGGLLGALITLAPHPLYDTYLDRVAVWGFTALEDQQLAGLLMWVPMGLVYTSACLFLAGRLVSFEERPPRDRSSFEPVVFEGGEP